MTVISCTCCRLHMEYLVHTEDLKAACQYLCYNFTAVGFTDDMMIHEWNERKNGVFADTCHLWLKMEEGR